MSSPINVARNLDAAFEASPAPKVASPPVAPPPAAQIDASAAPTITAAAKAQPAVAAAEAAKRKQRAARQREAWAGVAAVGECVVDMEREIAATLRQQRKLATVARRTLSECEDRSRWLQSVADAVALEQRLMATMRTELERDIALTQRREDATRQAAAGHRHIPADGFSALAAEEEAADERLAALEREAEALKRVMERLTEREAASKEALEKLDAREAALRAGYRTLDTAKRENAVAELHLEDRERAATRHDAEIARWSTSLDAREAELMRRSRHLEECFSTLARAERSLGLAAQPSNVGYTTAAGAGAHHVAIDRDDFTSSTSSDDE